MVLALGCSGGGSSDGGGGGASAGGSAGASLGGAGGASGGASGAAGVGGGGPSYPRDGELRLNHLQLKATHNSYHIEPDGNFIPDWMYTRDPLDVQAADQGVRGFELDTSYADGGIRVFHVPTLDDETVCDTLQICLEQLKSWSESNPGHHTLFVQIEPKDEGFNQSPPFDDYAARVDEVILSVWPRERIVTPDRVQGAEATLADAVATKGWPTLGETRNQILFFLDDGGAFRDAYTAGGTTTEGRLIFPDYDLGHPLSAFSVINGPENPDIAAALGVGMMVRTRADTITETDIDPRRAAAVASGAQVVTTDYPVADQSVGRFDLPDGSPSRCNPVLAPADCTPQDIESLSD